MTYYEQTRWVWCPDCWGRGWVYNNLTTIARKCRGCFGLTGWWVTR